MLLSIIIASTNGIEHHVLKSTARPKTWDVVPSRVFNGPERSV